ncbi:MAG: RIP metalloprotease RseP [Hyphomicrobiales bacterium]
MSVFDLPGMLATGFVGLIIPFLFIITLIVFFHELGHYLAGRWCGVRITTFSIGFGPELFGVNDKHGTRWRFALIPLGGYVKFLGDLNAASQPDDEGRSRLTPDERAVSFPAQVLWKRAVIVAAGPAASFLLAIMIFSATVYNYGRVVIIPKIDSVLAESAAEEAGLKAGDVVLSINGSDIESFSDLQRAVALSPGVPLKLEVDRLGDVIRLEVTPRLKAMPSPFGTQRVGQLGVSVSRDPASVQIKREGVVSSIAWGGIETWRVVDGTVRYLVGLFAGRATTDQLSGPVGIAKMSGEAAKLGLGALLMLAALMSASIGFINLLPIPMLDGGHLAFYLYEAIRGKALNETAMEWSFRAGFGLVVALTLFTLYLDIVR